MQGTITVAQAAKRVGKHKSTINRQIEAGKIVAQMDNERKYRVDVESLLSVYPEVESKPIEKEQATEQGNDAQILALEKNHSLAMQSAENALVQANVIASDRQSRIEEQRGVMIRQQDQIDDQNQTIAEQESKISRLETITSRAVNHARELAAENARLAARRWWQLR